MKKTINMKKTILIALVTFVCLLNNLPASVSLIGTALYSSSSGNPLGLTVGQIGIWLNRDESTTAWDTLFGTGKIASGLSLASDSTYDASKFTVMGSTAVLPITVNFDAS